MSAPPQGVLYMLPSALDSRALWRADTPAAVRECAHRLDYFLVESAKSARATLKRLEHPTPLRELDIVELPPERGGAPLRALLEPLRGGRSAGVISDAGCPGVADPGALAARAAHAMGIEVVPLVGPSSILLGLMASGLNGQSFAFHGYLPVDDAERARALTALEKTSAQLRQTQLFIETPYRNPALWQALLGSLQAGTRLALASGLTLESARIASRSVKDWKKLGTEPDNRTPVVFAIGQ